MEIRAVAVGLVMTLVLAFGCGEAAPPTKIRPEVLGQRFLEDPERAEAQLKGQRFHVRGKVLAAGATRLLLDGGSAQGRKLPAIACELEGENEAAAARSPGSFVNVLGTFDRHGGGTLVLRDCSLAP